MASVQPYLDPINSVIEFAYMAFLFFILSFPNVHNVVIF